MKILLSELLARVNDFYKAAGVLKIPTKLEAEVCNWINARYAKLMSDKLAKLINSLKKREGNHQHMSELHKKWEKLYYLIESIKDTNRYGGKDDLPKAINELVKFTSTNDLNIPDFSLQKKDPPSNWLGVVTKGNLSTLFRFEKKSKDTYRFQFIAHLTSKMLSKSAEENKDNYYSIKPVKTDVSNHNLNINDAATILIAQLDSIANVCSILDHFRSNYDYADPDYVKKLKMAHILSVKHAAPLEGDNSVMKVFSVNRQDISQSSAFKNISHFSFHVGLVPEEEKKNINVGEAWLGVWLALRNARSEGGGLNLGTIYVAADIESDFEEIQSNMDITKFFSRLNETTKHELRHFMQDVIDKLVGKEDVGGLPGKKIRDPNYNIHGININPKIQNHPVKNELLDESGRLNHALRDIEFYTRLSDEISKFNQTKSRLPLSLHQAFAYAWVGQITKEEFSARAAATFRLMAYKKHELDPANVEYSSHADRLAAMWVRDAESTFNNMEWNNKFFRALAAHQPLKYEKAVKEFMKAVGF